MEEEQAPAAPAAPPAKGKGMWIGVVVVVIVIVLLLVAVFGGLFAPSVPEEQVLKIGTVLTLTGTSGLEVFGPKNQRGAALAVEEINAAGGVLGRAIQIIHEDDTGVVATARDRAQKLITSDRVDAILGAVGSGFCAAVLEVTKPRQVVQISASCTSPIFSNLTYSEGWFFRTAPSDALQGVVAANYSYVNRSFTNMGVIGNNNPYGRGLANVFAEEFRSLGGAATVSIFAENAADYTTDLDTLITTGMEAIYLANYPTDGLKIMRNWWARASDPNHPWAGIQWVFSEGVLDQAGFVDQLVAAGIDATVVQGFQGSAPGAYLGIVGLNYDAFLTRYKAKYNNEDPGLFSANAYDAVYLIAAAAEKAGTATAAGIKAELRNVANAPGTTVTVGQWSTVRTEIAANRSVNYEGASGAVNLDQFGDPLSGYAIWGINATNRITTLHQFDEATVIRMLGAPPMRVAALANVGLTFQVSDLIAAAAVRGVDLAT